MRMRHRLVLAAALAGGASAQVPYRYLITAETGTVAGDAGLRFVEPATGAVSPVRPAPTLRATLSRALSVTVDPQQPQSIPFVTGVSTSIAPAFSRARVQGNELLGTTTHVLSGAVGVPNRIEAAPQGMLAAINVGTRPGLYLAPSMGGTAVLVDALPGAFDVTWQGGFAYVSSYLATATTQIDEVDLATNTVRTLASGYPALRAVLAISPTLLLAGTDGGALLTIDIATGAIVAGSNLFSVPILALAADDAARVFALTERGEVYDVGAPATPVYVSSQRVNDLAVGTVDLASFLTHGTGCAAAPAIPSRHLFTGIPSLGNGAFTAALGGGVANAPGMFVFGASRTTYLGVPLPIALDFLGMTGCRLATDVVATALVVLDAGGGTSVPLPIPNAMRLRGTHFTTQFFHFDPAANPAGFAASDGGEGIVR